MDKIIIVEIKENSNSKKLYLHPVKNSYDEIYDYDVLNEPYFWMQDIDQLDGLINLYKSEFIDEGTNEYLNVKKIQYDIAEMTTVIDRKIKE